MENQIQTDSQNLSADHPVRIYLDENEYLRKLIAEFKNTKFTDDFQAAYNLFNQIAQVDIRYTRKENQLFPYLEKRGWYGPSQGMWAFQDENRKLIKIVRSKLESSDFIDLQHDVDLMISEVERMMKVEEFRLLPMALELLKPEDWQAMKAGEAEIGWMHKTAQPPEETTSELDDEQNINGSFALSDSFLKLSEGRMNLEQINLMLQFIPFDLTFVDENDRVLFYNRGEERVFPRSAGVIGREVRFCHPPKSVSTVLEILEEFRAGRQDEAEFWINYRGKVIHIRYYAIRDKERNYKGVIEVSQDITKIQTLTGERRLLDWQS